jgi:hypothetical protein
MAVDSENAALLPEAVVIEWMGGEHRRPRKPDDPTETRRSDTPSR